ncbi:MAG: alpha/beta fold hydrolase [Candidatus Nanopelagicales bacterium]|nr:alpha/beta fold hydrolase [Candidatus Nanopelagicales bacterium]
MSTDATAETYPRQRARTRGFQLGRPRNFHLISDRVLFIRSASGNDAAGSLWALDLNSGAETCLVDVRTDIPSSDGDELPAAEKARRERMREVTGGITAYSVDSAGTFAAFAVNGIPFIVDLANNSVRAIAAPGPVVDPRINHAGTAVAYVIERSLYVTDIATDCATCIAAATHEHETWGLADFVAAEELARYRGFWWLPESEGSLLVECFDESNVNEWWIADPAQPGNEPQSRRYPAAGTANAVVELWVINANGERKQVIWDLDAFPYLATVTPSKFGTVLELLNREQNLVSIQLLNSQTGELTELQRRSDAAWVDVMSGVPCLDREQQLIEIVNDVSSDTYRLTRADEFVTPAGLQVRALIDHDTTSAVVAASREATTQALYRVNFESGVMTALTDEQSWSTGVVSGDTSVIVQADALKPHTTFTALNVDKPHVIANHAETPNINVRPHYVQAGERSLETCVLWPTGHVAGSKKLPVILSPYGGPHGQRVMRNAAAFTTEQWFADQGFAVIVTDNRGTPGRGPAWERAVHNDLATFPVADQVDALLALAQEQRDLDITRVGIRGWSFGGYLAALALMERPDIFSAAVAGAPVTDWALYDTAYTERYLGTPQGNPSAYASTSLLNKADTLEKPLLLIHGLADDNVFAAHTLQLSSALLAAGKSHSVVPLSGVTHMTPQEIVAENLLRLEVEFFRSHLGD